MYSTGMATIHLNFFLPLDETIVHCLSYGIQALQSGHTVCAITEDCGFHDSPTSNLDQYMWRVRSPVLGKTSNYIKNTARFLQTLLPMQSQSTETMARIDVSSLVSSPMRKTQKQWTPSGSS